MAAINVKSKNDTTNQSAAQILNQSFDQTFQTLAVEGLVYNPITGAMDRAVQAGNELPTSTTNPSETITETLVGSVLTTVIQKTIGVTVYTKTIVENYTTGVTTVSAWS